MRLHTRHLTVAASFVVLLVGVGPLATTAAGQYFGRNKVQYENFQFKVLKTEHFDIHYYPEAREAVDQSARMAERWYARLSRLFNHELSSRQTIILYADHPDFEQTTAIGGQIDEATGGVTEAFKRRIVLPMAGSLAETDHVLGHELVHAFQFDITTRSASRVGGQFPTALQMPLWFIEGMAEYLSLGPVYSLTAMWMHDAARRDKLPSFRQLSRPEFFPYRYGHALWAYIGGRWGDPVIGEILKSASVTGNVGLAISNVLDISPNDLIADWKASINSGYETLLEKTGDPEDYGRVVISPDKGSGKLNIAPSVSPNGQNVVFLSEKDRYSIEMFRADVKTGQIERKILKTALDPHFESLQFINSAGDWHPNGNEFVFAGISKGKPILTVTDTKRGKVTREFKIPEAGEVFNPDWSPDGRHVVYTAIVGGLMDLFIIDMESGERRRLTSDAYADLQPVWSPDGTRIAFVTDRFSTDLGTLQWGNYRLAVIDPESREIIALPGFEDGKNINPQWSRDGSSLYFLSDANGITNIYRIEFPYGQLFQVTQLTTGVSGITQLSPAMSVASETNLMIYSAYEGDRYTLYAIESDSILAGGPIQPPLADVSPAVLPPMDRPVGDVMALVRNAELGLPGSADEFETTRYRAGLSLDYIAPPQLAVGADRYGTFVGGGTALFWSDILGEHTLATLLQVNGSFQDIAALASYENRKSRWNWGVIGAQIPVLRRGFALAIDPLTGGFIEQEIRLRQTSREVAGLLAYPTSRAQRIEFGARYQNISFDNEFIVRTFTAGGTQTSEIKEDFPTCNEDPTNPFCTPDALNLVSGNTALVYDNAVFGYTGPVLGQRYRLEVTPVLGSINFVSGLADFRRYIMPLSPVTFAGRVIHFGRYGSGGEDLRLFPLFVGYQQILRGYDPGSFDASECQDDVSRKYLETSASSCPVYDQLFGSRLIVGNLEMRMPIPQVFGISSAAGLPGFTLAFFLDAGAAWWTAETARLVGGNRAPWRPVTSYGVAARLNLFGLALIEVDFVHPNDRPQKGWLWQFGFSPGF